MAGREKPGILSPMASVILGGGRETFLYLPLFKRSMVHPLVGIHAAVAKVGLFIVGKASESCSFGDSIGRWQSEFLTVSLSPKRGVNECVIPLRSNGF